MFIALFTKYLNRFLGLFPTALPTGMTSFDLWVTKIMATYSLPTTNKDDVAYSLAAMIMHSGPTCSRRSNQYFVICLRAAAAKQIAGAAFYEIKTRNDAAKKEAVTQTP